MDSYNQYLQKASSSTSKFASTLKSIGANVAIMLAITVAVKAVQYAWDKANTTVEEVKNKIDELSDSISTLESEYNSLREASSGGLTDAEQARLEYLEERIAREKELKELEEARLIREKYGNGFTDYFDEDNYNAKYSDFREKYFNGMSGIDVTSLSLGIDQNNQAVIDIGSKVDEYNKKSEEIQSYIDQMNRHDPKEQEYVWASELKEKADVKLENLISDLQIEYQNYKEAKYEAETAIEEMTADLDNPNLTKEDKETIQSWISQYQNVIKIADYYIGLIKDIPAVPSYADTDSYHNWFNGLSDAEKEIANSNEFKQALEEQKEKLNGATLSAEDYAAALQSVKDAQNQIDTDKTPNLSFTDTISQIQSLSKGLGQLDKIYADVYNKEGFDWSSILNNEDFEKAFGELGQTYDDFIEKISNAPDDIGACQEAFDNLVTSYIYSAKDENGNSIMSNLTEETKDATIAMLEQMGVENAAEVVTKSLALQTDYLAISKEFAASKSKDLADATWEDVASFMDEQQYSEEARVKLAELALAKITCNGTVLDFSGDISNLIGYIEILGGATNALKALNDAKSGKSFMYGGKENADALVKQAQKEVQDALDKASNYSYKVNYSGGSATNSAKNKASKGSGSGSSSPTKETKQEFDWVDRKLDVLSKKTEDLSEAFDEAYSVNDKDKAYVNYLSAIQEEIDGNNSAIDFYQQKLNEIGLSYEWIAKVQQGAFDISTITDQTLIDQIQQYQSIYEKILGLQDNVQSLERQRQKAEADHAKDVVETYEKEIEAFQKVIDKRKALVDLKETFGLSASEKDLKAEQDAYGKQINRIEEQNRGLIELMKTTTYDSEAWQIYNDKLEDNRNSIADLTQSLADLAKEMANLPLDKLDKYLEKNSKTNELYDAKIENATSAKSKNKLINKQISLTKKDNNKTQATAKETKKNLSDSIKGFKTAKNTDKKYAPSDQQAKIDAYYKKIQSYTKSKKQIPSSLISQLAEEGHSNLAQAATNYNAALVANETAQATAKLTAETTKTQLAELAKSKFDNTQTEYERKQNAINNKANIWSSKMDLSQAKGYLDSEIWYNQLIAYEQKNQSSLQKEANALQSRLDKAVTAGNIEKYSDEWWDMTEAISAVNEELEKGKVTLQEYKNQLDQIKFDNFDYIQDQISRLTSESDFYVKLMANKDLTDENGLTNYGIATLGLHYQNYDTLLAQAQKYGDEISKINADLANDPYNTTLIAQLQEYEDAQRDCILAAEEEKNAVIELKKQGYDALIDSLSDVIDKYKEFIRNAKDAYDYQNNISEQSDNISSLEKKIAAYSSMSGNEEIASKLQQAQKDLTKAQKDLEETMYEKYVSDTEDMLDDLLDELEEFTNELYNNLSEEFEASRQLAEDNANMINDTLIGLSSSYGVALSSAIQNVWGNGYTPEKGFQSILAKMDELINASNRDADKEADTLVYNDVKDKYDKGLSGYENNVSTAKSNYDNIISNRDDVKSQLAKEQEKLAKYIVQKTDKNGVTTTTYKKGYEAQKKKVDALKAQLKQLNADVKNAENVLSQANEEYNSVVSSNKNVVQDFLNKIVNSTSSKSEDKMTDLDKVIKQLTGGYIEDYNIQQLAYLLGTNTNEQEILEMLKKLGFSWILPPSIAMKYKSGSNNIPYDQLAWTQDGGQELVYRSTDGAILTPLGKGDKVFTNAMTENLWELAKMNPIQFSGVNITPTLPAFERNAGGVGDTNINLGGITMYGVNDPETFGRQLREEICKNGKTTKCLTEVVSSVQFGKGIGKANLYRH